MSFLELPLELRLIIYEHAAVEGAAVTIGACELTGKGPDLVHRVYGNKRAPYPGLPPLHEPTVHSGYSSRLLSVSKPAHIDVSSALCSPDAPPYHSTLSSLLALSHQINAEISTHVRIRNKRKTSLFIQFPLGLHVFKTSCPDFVRQARSIHIAGSYPKSASPNQSPHLEQLAHLVSTTLGKSPPHPIEKLEARIYFPGADSYPRVWEDSSPASVILRNVCGGYIDMEVARGRHGTGIYVSVRPHAENKRVISTVWRRLIEGDGGQPDCGDWVVDKQWPEWNTEFTPSSPLP
ncbi:hypothetical protein E4T42_02969 [Aureobasidium subglaciale]|uniref:Uncharacterized protein n=1 Tax=Aureobasidium subglaciale (strain EXF-2481) TaxID=1043005 RepID=A0A074YY98_AURSE|nr:uncharacterized protein AUEXF2481DRAFT_26359 [Aureobasidium subglaciale EXF-2481]KAI5207550.1 hypothetical protein E4T38_03198 [Aureobasidium subglaciale]KAI5226479.1 hypothetical protein E4T40_02972 [Aureobasidium subglaciale]KAI5229898.1 hypothetical protein E4T41_03195 [Aureobasidium subglaciale]KAI5253413.1 hypothetical protein E4T42_02969 [Aureobasidium subglaciale]KAI5264354.1 hypothetical protein E4T46_02973 [Aureobasidium subglaciale]